MHNNVILMKYCNIKSFMGWITKSFQFLICSKCSNDRMPPPGPPLAGLQDTKKDTQTLQSRQAKQQQNEAKQKCRNEGKFNINMFVFAMSNTSIFVKHIFQNTTFRSVECRVCTLANESRTARGSSPSINKEVVLYLTPSPRTVQSFSVAEATHI